MVQSDDRDTSAAGDPLEGLREGVRVDGLAVAVGQHREGGRGRRCVVRCRSCRLLPAHCCLPGKGPIRTPSLEVVNVAGDSAVGRGRIQSAPNL